MPRVRRMTQSDKSGNCPANAVPVAVSWASETKHPRIRSSRERIAIAAALAVQSANVGDSCLISRAPNEVVAALSRVMLGFL